MKRIESPEFLALVQAIREKPKSRDAISAFSDLVREEGNDDWADLIRDHLILQYDVIENSELRKSFGASVLVSMGQILPQLIADIHLTSVWRESFKMVLGQSPHPADENPLVNIQCGMICGMKLSMKQWLIHGPTIVRRCPVGSLYLYDFGQSVYRNNASNWTYRVEFAKREIPKYQPRTREFMSSKHMNMLVKDIEVRMDWRYLPVAFDENGKKEYRYYDFQRELSKACIAWALSVDPHYHGFK